MRVVEGMDSDSDRALAPTLNATSERNLRVNSLNTT
jgi:hypothetical protein